MAYHNLTTAEKNAIHEMERDVRDVRHHHPVSVIMATVSRVLRAQRLATEEADTLRPMMEALTPAARSIPAAARAHDEIMHRIHALDVAKHRIAPLVSKAYAVAHRAELTGDQLAQIRRDALT